MSRLAHAEARALVARARLNTTMETLQVELAPDRLARLARKELNAARVARKSVGVVQRYPAAVVGGVGLLVAILGRRRIAALFSRSGKPPEKPAAS